MSSDSREAGQRCAAPQDRNSTSQSRRAYRRFALHQTCRLSRCIYSNACFWVIETPPLMAGMRAQNGRRKDHGARSVIALAAEGPDLVIIPLGGLTRTRWKEVGQELGALRSIAT